MKDEIRRICKLVGDGRLSAEDAADLIDAFYVSEGRVEEYESGTESTPPPPPGTSKDPFKHFVESIEKLTKEGMDTVNWGEVSKQARHSAKKGLDALKTGIQDIGKGKVNLGWLTSTETREVTLPLKFQSGKTIKIENPVGNVKVVGGFDVGSISAIAKVKGANLEDAKDKAEAYTLIVEEGESSVVIRQPDMIGLHVDMEIQLPGSATLDIRTESGDILILDTQAGCRVFSQTGDIKLRGLNGPIEARTQTGDLSIEDSHTPSLVAENKSGDVSFRSVAGTQNVRSNTGSIKTRMCHGKVLSYETVAGTIDVDIDEAVTGSLNVRTVNGNVLIGVTDGCECRVSLSTIKGTVKCGFDLEDELKSEERISGRLGDGSGAIDASSVTGNLTFEMRDSASV